MGIHEVSDAASIIHDAVLDDATVIVGTTVNDAIKDGSISITVIATGFELRNSSPVNSFNSASSDLSKLNEADYFSGAFDTQPKSVMNNNNATKDREASRNFNNIEIPDFLKR